MSRSLRIGRIVADGDEKCDESRLLCDCDALTKRARGLVPGDDGVRSGGNAGQDEFSIRISLDSPLIRSDDDCRGHVRMEMAIHEYDAGFREDDRASVVLGIVAKIE